ncbi:hypothetical protein RB653_010169 [Dictyostelium firmibasis]|uniref:Uncharacterized protein n=1 Tax=Dictyostelium firmibasis TaxID=79012 RepID=A0AAN7TSQ5_9MYCE
MGWEVNKEKPNQNFEFQDPKSVKEFRGEISKTLKRMVGTN